MADDGESGAMMKVVVFCAAFIAILSLLLSGVSGIFGDDTSDDLSGVRDKRFNLGEFASFNWWTNHADPGNLTAVSEYMVGTYWEAPSAGDVAISGESLAVKGPGELAPTTDCRGARWDGAEGFQGDNGIHLYALNDGSWIAYREEGWFDRYWQVITMGDILSAVEHQDGLGYIARIQLDVGVKATMVFHFSSTGYLYDPADLLRNFGPYQVGVGQTSLDKMELTTDAWSVAAQLLTFNLQSTGVWWVDYLFSVVVWAMIGYTALMIISKFIPFT